MALGACSPLNKASTYGAICLVLLILSMVSKPGQAECSVEHCMSKCPSMCNDKAASSCQGAGGVDISKCLFGCKDGCSQNCPPGTTCDCDRRCDSYCNDGSHSPTHDFCVRAVFQHCKDTCEDDCKKGKNKGE
ncbi:hypothetical protein BS78_08G042500 [Paspalum vaginatum]|nr:hypothetical protein BS78_08G042500 [Paspalum vaginatum]